MSTTIEVTGRTLEEATRQAAEQLGIDPAKVAVTVLEETKGLFGRGQVRIRAEAPAPKPARGKAAVKAVEEPPAETAAEKPKSGRITKAKAKAQVLAEAPAPAPEPAKKTRGRAKAEEKPKPESDDLGDEAGEAVEASAEDSSQYAAILREIFDLGGLDATVREVDRSGRYVNLEIDGRDVAYLVGKHGEVLNALQYLLNVIGSRQIPSGARATLDGNNYRRRRETALRNLALQIAEQVRQRGEEAVLDALPAFERRIVHKSLQDYEGVATYSEGEEPERRVVIAPKE